MSAWLMHRRQGGYGRGGRQKIEHDVVEILSGIRLGRTMGTPVALLIRNLDHRNWREVMAVDPLVDGAGGESELRPVTAPRPGHADLAGGYKLDIDDMRVVVERASARETVVRVAAGTLSRILPRIL